MRKRNYPYVGLSSLSSPEDRKRVEGFAADDSMEDRRRWEEENLKRRMEQDLSLVPGIKQFEKELEEYSRPEASCVDGVMKDDESTVEDWDLVSMRSGASTPKARPASVISKSSDGTWTDTASTIVGKDDAGKGDESDAESESWEYVGE